MTQEERRVWLIKELQKEMPEYARIAMPETSEEQWYLLRGLFNVRMPGNASEEFLKVQDEFLQEMIEESGVIDAAEIETCAVDGRLAIWQGDITRLKVDAIVNACNSALLGCFHPNHNCIDNIIHTKAGIQLRSSCDNYMKAQAEKHGGAYAEPTGRAMITPGYNLPAKYVVHTVGPIVQPFLTEEHKRLLASCYSSALDAAAEKGLETIAFCCISTGVFMFPQDKACAIAVGTVREWLDRHPEASLKKVIFNVFKDEDLRLYEALLNRKS